MTLTKREKVLLAVLAILLIGGGFVYFLFMPLLEDYQNNEIIKADLEIQKQDMDLILNRYGNYDLRIDAYNERIIENLEHVSIDKYDEAVNQQFLNILLDNKVDVVEVTQTGYETKAISKYIYADDETVINSQLKTYVENLLNLENVPYTIPSIEDVVMHVNNINLVFSGSPEELNTMFTKYEKIIEDIIALNSTIYIASSSYSYSTTSLVFNVNINYYTIEGWQ